MTKAGDYVAIPIDDTRVGGSSDHWSDSPAVSVSELADLRDTDTADSAAAGPQSTWLPPIDFKKFRKTSAELKALKHNPGLLAYYEKQNDIIDGHADVEQLHRGEPNCQKKKKLAERRATRAIKLSFASSCLLLVVRVLVAAVSGSLSIIVTVLDAFLDVLSGGFLWLSSHYSRRKAPGQKYLYPVGRARMEPLGIIVFATIMGTLSFTVIVEGIRQLINDKPEYLPHAEVVIGGTVFVVIMKFGMYLYCRSSPNHTVQAFALDHLNDVIINTTGLAGALLGTYVWSWLDPAIAIMISLYIAYSWSQNAREHILNLIGLSASPEALQKLTYMAFLHAPTRVDTVRAYTYGNTLLAEVDIVLPEDMPLREAHDIGESLQNKLELLPEVSRAFVHLDYEFTHAAEHADV